MFRHKESSFFGGEFTQLYIDNHLKNSHSNIIWGKCNSNKEWLSLYHPYYVPNLNLPYEYRVPYPQYQTSPWYIAPTYDINRVPTGSVPSSYTYSEDSESGEIEISRSRLGLKHVYSPVYDSVAPRQDRWSK